MALVEIPVSVGEVIDKITILRIKLGRCGSKARENIATELELLEARAAPLGVSDDYYDMLSSVNSKLWDFEDAIRKKEARRVFDNEFVFFARMIYMYNDTRASIKRKINEMYGSSIVEEKIY